MRQHNKRDEWLVLTEEELMKETSLQSFRGSGTGGQKRNVTDSSVRVIHNATGIAVTAAESRSQYRNRILALRKLKYEIALTVRKKVSVEESYEYNPPAGSKGTDYLLWIAHVLDLLDHYEYQVSEAATHFNISTNRLVRDLSRDPQLWQYLSQQRQKRNLPALRHPRK